MSSWPKCTIDLRAECVALWRGWLSGRVPTYQPGFVVHWSSSIGSSSACELLFRLLGVDFAHSGKKAVPIRHNLKMLGLMANTENSASGSITITDTEDRRRELVDAMTAVLRAESFSPKEAEKLRRRMVFFEGYTFGSITNAAVKSLGRLSLNKTAKNVPTSDLSNTLRFLIRRVESADPVKVERCFSSTWLVFTDGACEAEKRFGGIGGILVAPNGSCVCFFSAEVPAWLTDKLLEESANPIHELELLPIYRATSLWVSKISRSQVVWFVDNESSRMAAIRGSGETTYALILIDAFVESECNSLIKSGFSRVPSHSNPADGASRLLCDLPLSLGAE